MIHKISGRLIELNDESATLDVPPLQYQVFIPDFSRRHLQSLIDKQVALFTVHYLEGNPQKGGKLIPRLIGFASEIEREFFEQFCSVDGVGVKKALRAMVRPVQDIARAIEQQDFKSVSTLPGIGPSTAERIVAKLRRKMGKFALLVPRDDESEDAPVVDRSVMDDTFQILCGLGHPEVEARRLLDRVLQSKKKFKDVDEMIQAVYDNSIGSES